MNVLLINNNSKHFLELKDLIKKTGSKVIVQDYNKINLKTINKFDLIILSGGQGLNVPKNRDKLSDEIQVIKKAKVPILGICLGFQLIADTFGARLKKREEIVRGLVKIRIIKGDKLFYNKKEFAAYEAHKWYLDVLDILPDELICLAKSDKDIEIIKHREKPIYGFQFHPEVLEKGNSSFQIFCKLLKSISKKV